MTEKKHWVEWANRFKWESEEQKKGFLAFWHWVRGKEGCTTDLLLAFLTQKEHESAEWFIAIIASQSKAAQEEIFRLQNQLSEVRGRLDALEGKVVSEPGYSEFPG